MSAPAGNGAARGSRAQAWLEDAIFGHRALILVLFAAGSLLLVALALHGLRIDTSFNKTLPVRHEYMRTYLDPKVAEFRGANRVLVALIARNGDMFTLRFRDYPKLPKFARHRTAIALMSPPAE